MQPESSRKSHFYIPILLFVEKNAFRSRDYSVAGYRKELPAKGQNLVLICAITATLIFITTGSLTGCGVTRATTTVHSAVEAALVSKAIRDAVGSIQIPEPTLKPSTIGSPRQAIRNSFYIQPLSITAASRINMIVSTEDIRKPVAADDAHNALLKHMLERGYVLASSAKAARYHIYPTLHYAEVDDNQYTFGIPSIPIPMPNVGTVNTPELALLGLHSQFGRAKVSVLMLENPAGSYVGAFESPVNQSSYNRWKLLFFFGWRTTNLPIPF